MRLHKRFITLLSVLLSLAASAQSVRDEIAANPEKAGGIYYAYNYDDPSSTAVPAGYHPVYISHYGRHGSRWLLKDEEYTSVLGAFDAAAAAGALTERGREVYERVKIVCADGALRAGDLSPVGVEQQRQIAGRMFGSFGELFADDVEVNAVSTFVPRCILSMAAFCERLKELNPNLKITREAGMRTTRYLNFFYKPANPTLCAEYLDFIDKGAWRDDYKQLMDSLLQPDRLMRELFSDAKFVLTIDARKLMRGLFFFAVDMQNVEIEISFYDLFTSDELYRLWVCDNYQYYIIRGPATVNKCFPRYYAKVLLEDMLAKADLALASGSPAADIRFGHDGNIMPFVNLMQFEGCTAVAADAQAIAEVWPLYKISPMAANIQLVLFRKEGSDDVLVKFLFNEREVRIPLASDVAPYYHWSDVRAFYRAELDSLSDPAE